MIADLSLSAGGEVVQYPSYRAGRISRVQCGEDQVSRLGGHKRHRYCLGVAHFADEYYVRVLAEHFFQTCNEGFDVPSELALGDDGVFLGEDVFDGVLDGHNSAGTFFADSVN